MLNTTNTTTNIKTPATGILQKSNKDSYFLRFHANSTMADNLFKMNPEQRHVPIHLLQVLLINDGYMLAEVVDTDKY